MMKFIALVVEGPTEEIFVKEVLNRYLNPRDIHAIPTVAKTKTTPTGSFKGGAPWRQYRNLARLLASQPDKAVVGILMDFYGLPPDTPGFEADGSGVAYRDRLLLRMSEDADSYRIRPHLVLHEFETLVLAAIDAGAQASLADQEVADIQAVIREYGGDVEAVNGSTATSPSHRLVAACPGYIKTATGISLLNEVAFEDVLERCPTFAAWLTSLIEDASAHRR